MGSSDVIRLQPEDAAQVAAMLREAASADQKFTISAGGSKKDFGRPVAATHLLDMRRLSGISDYEPAELFLTAQAATPLAEITALLDEHNQMLAFEPPDWSTLLPGDGAPTLGGTIACNMGGPRRVRAGAARDHFLGFSAVDGRGDIWKSGGKVVKNVTGYDMCKLQAGAFGTLSVLLETTVRLLPKPETSCSLVFAGLGDREAVRLLSKALNSPHEVSAAAHLPPQIAARSRIAAALPAGAAATILRLEGPHPSVAFRASELRIETAESIALWQDIGAVQPLLAATNSIIWRICTAPSEAAEALRSVQSQVPAVQAFFDWGGGLLWLELQADPQADIIRAAIAKSGGHATLLRADAGQRTEIPVFQPQAPALDALSRRVKNGFDPLGLLNPGRMQQGF
jgi:glycolate oxidase FAD binding subunit